MCGVFYYLYLDKLVDELYVQVLKYKSLRGNTPQITILLLFGDIIMSEQQIFKDHYELQQEHKILKTSLQNIFNALFPHVSPEGVQLSLQEVIDLTVQRLAQLGGEVAGEAKQIVHHDVEKEIHEEDDTVHAVCGPDQD